MQVWFIRGDIVRKLIDVGLMDIDSKIPNHALMKISAFCKSINKTVEFVNGYNKYKKIYGSCVFTENKYKCEELINFYGEKIDIGGTGWDIQKQLPKEIEEINPDYNLYNIDYGVGFTARGCTNNCPFCFVPMKEGYIHQYREIKDIINPKSNKLVLLDNNFTEDPNMIEKAKEIIQRDLIVDLCQGVNIRVMTEERAYWISQIKHMKQLHIAWDNIKDEKRVMEGIKNLSKYMKLYKVMCYVLVGFNSTLEEDLYRINKLEKLNVDPFVMVYNQKNDKELQHLARWCNKPWIRKKCDFKEYKPYVKMQSTINQLVMW